MTLKRKLLRIFINTTKIVLALGMLYLFVCSLDLLSSSFRLIAGKTAGIKKFNDISNSTVLNAHTLRIVTCRWNFSI